MKRIMVVAGVAAAWTAAPAWSGENVMQACGAKYRAAKAANQLPTGQTWPHFLAACRSSTPASAFASARPAPGAAAAPRPTRTPSADQLAARDRQHRCGAMWKADKAAGKLSAGETWPHYWSACNARLKG